jgi:hypothetical protein
MDVAQFHILLVDDLADAADTCGSPLASLDHCSLNSSLDVMSLDGSGLFKFRRRGFGCFALDI